MELIPAEVPITEVLLKNSIQLSIKREDLVHPSIPGNKFWKPYYNIKNYLASGPADPHLITFGGAFSNHILAVSGVGKLFKIKTTGIIRGEEMAGKLAETPTLAQAVGNGMVLELVSREDYRDKVGLTAALRRRFPGALIIPEGGTNTLAVEGVRHMLSGQTAQFDYLCAPVGTGGTLAGMSKFCECHQKVLGFSVVKDASLAQKISDLSGKDNFEIMAADYGGYGKISDEVVAFINGVYAGYKIPLDPIYTGKMMLKMFTLVEQGFFPQGSRILAFHTGGLQGIAGANAFLQRKNRPIINFD